MTNASNLKKTPEVQITVIFATYNGGSKLRKFLEALATQTLDKDLWKVVAIDNGSSDRSFDLLASFRDKLPLRVYIETERGKTAALNKAFQHLEGALTVITDDDIIPDKDWLENFLGVSKDHPECDIFSGLIAPFWEINPPQWIQEYVDLAPVFAINEGALEGPITGHRVFGPNSAFRTHILPKCYGVTAKSLGPNSRNSEYAMGGDTALAIKLEHLGHRCHHTTKARVRHIIPKAYLNESWILGRATRFGRGVVYAHPSRVRFHKLAAYLIVTANKAIVFAVHPLPTSRFRWQTLWRSYIRIGTYTEVIETLK